MLSQEEKNKLSKLGWYVLPDFSNEKTTYLYKKGSGNWNNMICSKLSKDEKNIVVSK